MGLSIFKTHGTAGAKDESTWNQSKPVPEKTKN
jgi:hypothetical protein